MLFKPEMGSPLVIMFMYSLQHGDTPLHLAAREGYTIFVEHLLSSSGIAVNIKNEVSGSI